MAKRSQLVCQYVENISRTMLEEYQDVIRSYVRQRSGIYALYRRNRLYNVGLARSLLGRLKQHLKDKHAGSWDHFSVYLTVGTQFMKEIESVLLRVAAPPGNKVKGRFLKADNLLPQLRTDLTRKQKKERSTLLGGYHRVKRGAEDDRKVHVLAKYLPQARKLRAKCRGKTLRASVRRDGRIRFKGQLYPSPSKAAAAAGRPCNGWKFWTYERAPGDWVAIDELRR